MEKNMFQSGSKGGLIDGNIGLFVCHTFSTITKKVATITKEVATITTEGATISTDCSTDCTWGPIYGSESLKLGDVLLT